MCISDRDKAVVGAGQQTVAVAVQIQAALDLDAADVGRAHACLLYTSFFCGKAAGFPLPPLNAGVGP